MADDNESHTADNNNNSNNNNNNSNSNNTDDNNTTDAKNSNDDNKPETPELEPRLASCRRGLSSVSVLVLVC